MAYRTYVGTTGKDSIQILGNNEGYGPLFDELKRQKFKIDQDGCYRGKVKEIQPIIDILEKYIWDKDEQIKKWKERYGAKADIFNLRPTETELECGGLTYQMIEHQRNAYIFVTANLVNYLEDNLDEVYDSERNEFVYEIKEGKEVWFEAY